MVRRVTIFITYYVVYRGRIHDVHAQELELVLLGSPHLAQQKHDQSPNEFGWDEDCEK